MNWDPFILTFQLATIVTILLFLLALPLASWLANTKVRWKPVIEALVSMPLVLPPTVLGFYLLMTLSPHSMLGSWFHEVLGLDLIFSFTGIVIASLVYSLPFMVQPLQSGFSSLPKSIKEASYLLGKTKFETFVKIVLPSVKSSILTACILTFAHTVGEFGVVLMIGGSVPNQTKVASIAIYEEVEKMNYANAHQYSFVLFGITFFVLLLVYILNGKKKIIF